MMKKRKGFVVAELIFGFIFLTMFILTNIMIHVNALKNVKEIQRQTVATNLIIKKLEEIQAVSYESVDNETYYPIENQNYLITVTVNELTNPPELVDYYNLIKEVTVNITYKVGGNNEQVEIKILRVGPMTLIPVEEPTV